MKFWIIRYHHRHGVDAWPVANEDRPDLEEIENGLDDFEPEREEFVEADGPFDLQDEHLLDLLKDIISSSDTNCGDSLANAICAAKDAVYSIEGDKPTEPPMSDHTQQLATALKAILAYEDDVPPPGTKGAEIYAAARTALADYGDPAPPSVYTFNASMTITLVATDTCECNPDEVEQAYDEWIGDLQGEPEETFTTDGQTAWTIAAAYEVTKEGYDRLDHSRCI